jgi:hypothetical protein
MRLPRERLLVLGLFLVSSVGLGLGGCSRGPGENFVPVTGAVMVGGAPLASGAVTFHPDAAKGNDSQHLPVGALNAEGRYELRTATAKGAPPGWYRVTVSAQAPIDPNNPYAPPKNLIHPKFSDAGTSGLAVEVTGQPAAGAYDFAVTK